MGSSLSHVHVTQDSILSWEMLQEGVRLENTGMHAEQRAPGEAAIAEATKDTQHARFKLSTHNLQLSPLLNGMLMTCCINTE